MKLRIVKDNYCGYEVQVWNWWWPFWRQASYANTHSSVENAEEWAKNYQKKFVVKYLDFKENSK